MKKMWLFVGLMALAVITLLFDLGAKGLDAGARIEEARAAVEAAKAAQIAATGLTVVAALNAFTLVLVAVVPALVMGLVCWLIFRSRTHRPEVGRRKRFLQPGRQRRQAQQPALMNTDQIKDVLFQRWMDEQLLGSSVRTVHYQGEIGPGPGQEEAQWVEVEDDELDW